MTQSVIFQDSILVSGIMCFDGCGNLIQSSLNSCISDFIEQKYLPPDAKLIVDAEPFGLGIHKLRISIESNLNDFAISEDTNTIIAKEIRENIGFEVIDNLEEKSHKNKKKNWINILVNLLSIFAIISLNILFPPSILLSSSMILLSMLSTAYSSSAYLLNFISNLRRKNLANMSTTISLGWILSMAHSIYHTASMPLISHFSMVFMNFMMPGLLISCINLMDEIKRLIIEKSKKIQLRGIKSLFPQMSDTYLCYHLSDEQLKNIDIHLENEQAFVEKRSLLKEGMFIVVKTGECFPVDCSLVKGNTVIDASLLTGEPYQSKKQGQDIPSGAINLGQTVIAHAKKDAYNSTVNTLLFRSNRARDNEKEQRIIPKFAYFYSTLIFVGIIAAVVMPVILGIASVSLIMQNLIGILFSICPCTIAIAHELPPLISLHQRSQKGIQLADQSLTSMGENKIETIVFDKTGTLTTGNSIVESSDIPLNSPCWQRIYLLEKTYGRGHPLAKAIQSHYENKINKKVMFSTVDDYQADEKNRGLMATVQGKKLQIGSADYLKDHHINVPEADKLKMSQGFSAVSVAENGQFIGFIYIKHEIRTGLFQALSQLKKQGKRLIMLTGDNLPSAHGLNRQLKGIFAEEAIHAGQSPKDKEAFLTKIMDEKECSAKAVWFIGDGLNDAPCCRVVSEKGGISCSMQPNDKSAFFSDISLNGSLDYIFKHNDLNKGLEQTITENKGILIFSTIALMSFIIGFSIATVAISPLIPMAIMLSSTLLVLFNSYRTKLIIDCTLGKETSWPKKVLSSQLSIGALMAASCLLICSSLVATFVTGGLALPIITFSAGTPLLFSSICSLTAFGLLTAFLGFFTACCFDEITNKEKIELSSNLSRDNDECHHENLTNIADKINYGSLFNAQKEAVFESEDIGMSINMQYN